MIVTDATIERLRAKPKGYRVTDGGKVGLQVYVGKSGDKTFYWRGNVRNKGELRFVLGVYPVMDVATARARAADMTALAKAGRDPTLKSNQPKNEPTVGEVLENYIAKLKKDNATTADHTRKLLSPVKKDEKGNKLSPGVMDVFRDSCLDDFSNEIVGWMNTNYDKPNRRGVGKAVVIVIRAAFNLAMENPSFVFPDKFVNPGSYMFNDDYACPWVLEHEPKTRAHIFKADEKAKLEQAFETIYENGMHWLPGFMILELCYYTGARPSELARATEDELTSIVHNDKPGFVITKVQHKNSGRRKKKSATSKTRKIFITEPAAIKVIERSRAFKKERDIESPYLFPSCPDSPNGKHPYIDELEHYNTVLKRYSGLKFMPYNLRSNEINRLLNQHGRAKIDTVAQLVGNSPATIDRHYRLLDDSQMLDLLHASSHTANSELSPEERDVFEMMKNTANAA